jgi:hypothetical protein
VQLDRSLLIVGALISVALLVAGALAGSALSRWWRGLLARRRAARATRGERDAEGMLARAGWTVEARQVVRTLRFEVDGAPAEASVRCDLLVSRGGRRCVAEVKTGQLAPRLDHAPTRRQLLEYRLAFDVDGVLLVDAGAGSIREVRFPALTARPRRLVACALAFALGTAAGLGAHLLMP